MKFVVLLALVAVAFAQYYGNQNQQYQQQTTTRYNQYQQPSYNTGYGYNTQGSTGYNSQYGTTGYNSQYGTTGYPAQRDQQFFNGVGTTAPVLAAATALVAMAL